MNDVHVTPHPLIAMLRPGLVRLRHAEPHAEAAGMATNAYAVLAPGRALLVDAGFLDLMPAIAAFAADGFAPSALVFTHRHVVAQSDAIDALATAYQVPFLLLPRESAHPQAQQSGLQFDDPAGHEALTAVGMEALPFPGHTAGHLVLYGTSGGGVLLAGDCAMGALRAEAAAGMASLVRPPEGLTVDDRELRQQWVAFDRPVATICPFHGEPLVDDVDAVFHALESLRTATPTRTLGVGGAFSRI
ncbi:MAG TPA: hypothetical protein VE869_05300 [Gemmatimonas sp.]|nr:hypothetical protein [Gemmatimonas sp.]